MRIALLYPPPWKIPEAGEAPDPVDGPPPEFQPGDLDADFHQTPYGLFSLGAQAIRAGHDVKVLNLSAYTWKQTCEVVAALDAQLFGMSCWTANRRGVKLVAELIKELHPKAHVVVGGPHASPLAKEVLEHFSAVDTVCTGESEESFMELIERLGAGKSTRAIAGTFYRDGAQIVKGPPRGSIHDLDGLESPHRHFATHIVMTSRGCPWQCTFCGAETTWGRGFRGQTIPYVLDALEAALERVPVKMLLIKDDTFTANKKRAMDICRGIRERKLNFLWSCDTRVDVLTEELLREMRLAGCQRLSLGVESGSPAILKAIDKKITPDKIVRAADMAKKFGIQVRFYMMLGNRGETEQTFRETLEFLERAKPHQYLFSCLSVYPGTIDFHDAEKAGWLSRDEYFEGNFQELKVPFDVSPADAALMAEWFEENKGLQHCYAPDARTCAAILDELGEHHAAHMDLAGAYFEEGDLDGAERHARRALELDTPVPGLAHNLLACVALRRQDYKGMQEQLRTALRTDPYHFVVAKNAEALRVWFSRGGPHSGTPLHLDPRHEFQLFERTQQPALPGPLPDGFFEWHEPRAELPSPEAPGPRRLMVVE
jgi:radical SAM superfamily enzyme YgiQ (UPF0313 family)